MSEAEVIAAIRANHIKANIGWIEDQGKRPKHLGTGRRITIHWQRAWLDGGGSGGWYYIHVPITGYWGGDEETTHRVYPPARLRRKFALAFAAQPQTEEQP